MAGLGAHSSLLSTVGIGMVNFIFTLLAINIIDKVGRKTLMFIGSIGLIISLGLVAFAFLGGSSSGFEIPIYVMLFIAFFAFFAGCGYLGIHFRDLPKSGQGKGQTLGSSTHWVMAALIAFCFPYLAESFGGANIFSFLCNDGPAIGIRLENDAGN